MLISEIKELLKKYQEEDLKLIISEMYRSIPKKIREEKNIDDMLTDIKAFKNIGKVELQKTPIQISELKEEILQFLDYAYKSYYFAPNNFVHKKERPKWRFKVKAYIKDLQGITAYGEEGKTTTDLLEALYKMLCYACFYYLFSTDDPFRSISIDKTDLLEIIIKRRFAYGISKASLKSCVELVSHTNASTIPLISNLKSSDSKLMTIELAKIVKEELEKSRRTSNKNSSLIENSDYWYHEKINRLVEIVFRLNISLCEYDTAIQYFNNNNIESDKEITLYVLLRLLYEYDLKTYWVNEYNKSINKKIHPRQVLENIYNHIMENEKFPENFYL